MTKVLAYMLIAAATFAVGLTSTLAVPDADPDPTPALDAVPRQGGDIPDLLVIANQTAPVELVFNRTDPWGDIPDMTVIAFADAAGRVASAEAQTSAEREANENG